MGASAAGAEPFVPAGADLHRLREAVQDCRGCDLYRAATQAVFSTGHATAPIVLVGEVPGDEEDKAGRPFVGPAGRVLRRALRDVDIDPEQTYVTNVVKHFKFSLRGKRRIHQKPSPFEIDACRPWLRAEFALLDPRIVVALGATAAQALAGASFRVTKSRGVLMPWPESAHRPEDFPTRSPGAQFLATLHPSAILRADDQEEAYEGFRADLAVVAAALASR
ncbi:MAG TPA: UdgX family uracil-DNA binding protein [Micromonosporaceae bacterium]|nr:UdgX family uracil-DNA binding protein [Micromonosporaceae bacterium]